MPVVHGVAFPADGHGVFHGDIRELPEHGAQVLIGRARIAENDRDGFFRLHVAGERQNIL